MLMTYGNEFEAEVIRTYRRGSMLVKVKAGKVSVFVPKSTRKTEIQHLLAEKCQWIQNALRIQRSVPPMPPRAYISGESFLYLGLPYSLQVIAGSCGDVWLQGQQLIVQVSKRVHQQRAYVHKAIEKWYRRQAREQLLLKIAQFSPFVGETPYSVGVKTFKSQWGNCSLDGKIDFNWKIIMAPSLVVDYVVVHELCHLIHHDHSKRFWHLVACVMPDYAVRKQWLKEHGRLLELSTVLNQHVPFLPKPVLS